MSEMIPGTIDKVIQAAKASKGEATKITGHWSAGRWIPNHVDLADYHILIIQDGTFLMREDFAEVLAHTWHRNTGNLGMAFAGCYGATTEDLGDYAPTEEQISTMAMLVNLICGVWDRAIGDTFFTHCEVATEDDYGPGSGDPETRWDLWFLRNGEPKGTGGNLIRQMALEMNE